MTIHIKNAVTNINKLYEMICTAFKEKGEDIPEEISTCEKLKQYIGFSEEDYEEVIIKSICGLPHSVTNGDPSLKYRFMDTFGSVIIAIKDGRKDSLSIENDLETGIYNGKGLKELHPVFQELIFENIEEIASDIGNYPEYKGHLEDVYMEEGYPLWYKIIGDETVVRAFQDAADIIQLDFDKLMSKAGIPEGEKKKFKKSLEDRFELKYLRPFYRRISMARIMGLL